MTLRQKLAIMIPCFLLGFTLSYCGGREWPTEPDPTEGERPSHGQQSSRNYSVDSVGVDTTSVHADSLSQ